MWYKVENLEFLRGTLVHGPVAHLKIFMHLHTSTYIYMLLGMIIHHGGVVASIKVKSNDVHRPNAAINGRRASMWTPRSSLNPESSR